MSMNIGISSSCDVSGLCVGLYGYELRALQFIGIGNGCSLWQLSSAFGITRFDNGYIYTRRLVELGLISKRRLGLVVMYRLTDSGRTYLDYLISIDGIPEHPHKRKRDQEQRVKRKYTKRPKDNEDDTLGLF